MHLENFDLEDPAGTIQLIGLGHNWDLHNCVDFAGFQYDPRRQEFALRWVVLAEYGNPWGSPGNNATACTIRFTGVTRVALENVAPPSNGGLQVAGVSKVSPDREETKKQSQWPADEEFHLLFSFEDRSSIEISAESARLEPEE